MHLVLDSTGLKLFGQGEWYEEKHGGARRSWRKLHLAVDADTGEIVAGMLTDNVADNAGQVPALPGHHAAGNSYSGDHSECSGSRCGSEMP
jgi:hypothetical protein